MRGFWMKLYSNKLATPETTPGGGGGGGGGLSLDPSPKSSNYKNLKG